MRNYTYFPSIRLKEKEMKTKKGISFLSIRQQLSRELGVEVSSVSNVQDILQQASRMGVKDIAVSSDEFEVIRKFAEENGFEVKNNRFFGKNFYINA